MTGERPEKPNLKNLLEAFDGDKEIMTEIVNVFLTESPSQLDAIELAAQEGDCYGLESASHSLKGAVSNFGNTELAADLGRIEILMREGHRDEAFKLARCVRPRLDTFRAELQRQVGAIL